MAIKDGLASKEFNSETVSGTNIYGADIVVGAGTIGTTEIADSAISGTKLASGCIINRFLDSNACSGTKVSSEYSTIAIGSPVAYGNSVQAGTGVMNITTGSIGVTFGKAFTGTPYVVASYKLGNTVATIGSQILEIGSVSTSGFTAYGITDGGSTFNWFATGSGRI